MRSSWAVAVLCVYMCTSRSGDVMCVHAVVEIAFDLCKDKWLTQLNFGRPYSCFVRKMSDGRQLFLALYMCTSRCGDVMCVHVH